VTKILIATPSHGEIFFTPYVQSIIRVQRLIDRQGWNSIFLTISYAEIAESRNFLLTHWFDKTDASHILFIDSDMGFEAKLIADMLAFDKPVVGAVYPKRQIDLKRVAALTDRGETGERAVARAHDFVVRRLRQPGAVRPVKGFIQVEGCGAGVLLIQRSCIETMLKKMPEVSDATAKKNSPLARDLDRLIRPFDVVHADGARLSEDYSFCHRWRQGCGGEIWANIAHHITHIGLHRFAGRYQDVMPRGPRVTVGGKAAAPKTAVRVSEASPKGLEGNGERRPIKTVTGHFGMRPKQDPPK
jgi:hypothetical protein